MIDPSSFSLDAKYTVDEGTIILTGAQALVRLPIDQHKADTQKGLNTGTLISGYRGSPLGGIDFLLQRSAKLLEDHNIVFMPGVNEDLAATAILGSQTANLMPQPKYDGVVGVWYGKGPGVDRTGDIFKHAQITGVGRYGGVLALAGDDPTAKSSTIPSHSEIALYDAQMPILYPGNVQDVLDMGRWGFELSRYCGSWVGFKIVTNVADEFSTAKVGPDRVNIVTPNFVYQGHPWQHTQNPALLAPHSLNQEREIYEGRLEAAKAWGAANKVNRIVVSSGDDWLGIIAPGKTYYDVRESLQQLGFDDHALQENGIRILKVGMIYPLEPDIIREFAQGLDEIFVIEEKRAFVELFARDILYDLPERPRIVGKRDEDGQFLIRGDYELDANQLVPILAERLKKRLSAEPIDARLAALKGPEEPLILNLAGGGDASATRTPYFCSGCPHNRSTVVPEGSLQGGGIGCHTLAILMDRNMLGVTQMGGEGAQWAGASYFSNIPHIFQNIGDGTLFHSGSMAIRQALTTPANMTYKILHNGAVAMTGGQKADGEIPVPDLTRLFEAEGVVRTIVVANDPEKYGADARWSEGTEVWHRDRLDEAQEILRDTPGITALIYDQPCATELRRNRKRGLAHDPEMRVFINEAVCEGCGDCGAKSNCLSVFPVETEFGRKTQIHQSSCNKDYTCLDGDCPAFITVIPDKNSIGKPTKKDFYRVEQTLPDPVRKVPENSNLYLMGIGGTGVVTINQVLSTAALLDGKHIISLDQTGLSQKGGPVVSNLKIFTEPVEVSNKIAFADADAYIVFDVLNGTTDDNLKRAHPNKTIAIVSSSEIPTGSMIRLTDVPFPNGERLKGLIERRSRSVDNVYLDAINLAENLFGNHMPANLITIGAAYQAGAIALSASAIEQAITLNGVAVEANLNAFRVGRLVVADPSWVHTLHITRVGEVKAKPKVTPQAQTLIDQIEAVGDLPSILEMRVPELIAYQNKAYAQAYVTFIKQVVQAEQAAMPGKTALSEAVARYLYKLMAYKDEYEVARLHLKSELSDAINEQFGTNAKTSYMLHPPFLKSVGLQSKIKLGKWFDRGFQMLVALRGLRGTPLDLFGYTEMRRLERNLIGEYRTLIEQAMATLSPATYDQAVKLANLPDVIRGYEDVKLKNVARFRDKVAEVQAEEVMPETMDLTSVL
ncbi:MAG: indolepyruvate ferredoxin oxidoreductase family protein [Chloroflexota bacterium]